MTTKTRIEELLETHAPITEMKNLLAKESLRDEEKRELIAHVMIAESVRNIPLKTIPDSLLQTLYSIEEGALKHPMNRIQSPTEFLPYATIAIATATILLLPSSLVYDILKYGFIAALGSGFVFYEMMKSNFFTT